MTRILLKLLCILIITWVNVVSADDHSHFNASILIKNERLLGKFVDCILDEGPCIGPIAKLKNAVPQVLETQCETCQEQIKALAAKVMLHIRDTRPEQWAKIQEMYDPDQKFQEKLDELLETYQ